MDIILFGPPGAGKGTQAGLISKILDIPHLSTGNIFRLHIKNDTGLGKKVRSYTDDGQLVPDDIVLEVVASRLNDDDTRGVVLFDGFPRTINQANGLVEWLNKHNRKIDGLICIDVPDEEVCRRLVNRRTCLSCGESYHLIYKPPTKPDECDLCSGDVVQRNDDKIEKVKQRLESYHQWTSPILGHLSGISDIVTINGVGDISSISNNVKNQLHTWLDSIAENS
jgi:adenylate kinase